MGRFTLPRDLYYGKGSLENLKNIDGKKAIVVSGGSSMRRGGFLDKVEAYLKEAGMEVQLFEGVEPDPSVETVMKGAKAMTDFQPDVIVAIGGGSPIDAAKAMWAFYEYPEVTFEQLCTPFSFPKLRQKAKFVAIPSTSGTATEVTAFSVITDYAKGIIDITNEMGPYYVLTDDVALIHGRPETGVLKKQLAVTVLRKPIKFSEDGKPVRLLVALATTDSESHMSVIQTLAQLFMDEEALKELIQAETAEDVYEYLLEFDRKVQEYS